MSLVNAWPIALALIFSAGLVCGHESPEHEIEDLTARMAASGKTAELLRRRASEWRALGRLNDASIDLHEAVAMSPEPIMLLGELGQVEAAAGRYESALKAVDRGMTLATHELGRAELHMLRAEILERKGDYEAALAACNRAFSTTSPAVDWYLTRGRLQARLGRWRECAAGLERGFEETGSIVLEIEWIEALIDAGEYEAALQRIERYAERGRWKSAWLLRRARAQMGLGHTAQAEMDLKRAQAELAERLTSGKAELSLLIERGLVQALLKNKAGAEADVRRIEELRGESTIFSSSLHRLERILRH